MRPAHLACGVIATALASAAASTPAHAQDVKAGAPIDLSVTIYRAPYRDSGSIDLDYLEGFALVTETRRVVIPAGSHRVRFEGVADGIDAASAIVTGLPDGVVEKNRDGALLSPSALVEATAAQDNRVFLNRTDPATGKMTSTEAKVRSGAGGGVVFETADGVEALRCSGLPETFSFSTSTLGLSALPTLSVLTRSEAPVDAVVQLSYLSDGFDWAANYTADLSATGGKMKYGGWITLANSNGTSFPKARVQVVAGSLNHETGNVDPISMGQPILARCWPKGSTSDGTPVSTLKPAMAARHDRDVVIVTANKREETVEDIAVAVTAIQEELGDLKLFRVPDRTTLASRQSKQIRLLDRAAIPVTKTYYARVFTGYPMDYVPMTRALRTQNDKKNNLGLPLPSGSVSVFETTGKGSATQHILAGEGGMRDLAINEEVEILLEGGPDIQVRNIKEVADIASNLQPPPEPPFLKGATMRTGYRLNELSRIEITNARPYPIQAEIDLYVEDGAELVKADHTPERKNGRPIFKVTVPANDTFIIRYQTSKPR